MAVSELRIVVYIYSVGCCASISLQRHSVMKENCVKRYSIRDIQGNDCALRNY